MKNLELTEKEELFFNVVFYNEYNISHSLFISNKYESLLNLKINQNDYDLKLDSKEEVMQHIKDSVLHFFPSDRYKFNNLNEACEITYNNIVDSYN